MSALSRTSTRIAVGALIATGFAVAVASPISAHTGELFTVTFTVDGTPADSRFATISGTDASLTALAGGPSAARYSSGVEIADEVAYAILGVEDDDDDEEPPQLLVWDHNTGAVISTTDITLDLAGAFLLDAYALDTSPSGTLLAFGDLQIGNGEFPTFSSWVLEIDPTTGIATPVVDLAGLEPGQIIDLRLYLDSIATNPVTGETYIFYDYNQDEQFAALLNLTAGSYGPEITLTQIVDDLNLGYFGGADFDTAGTLWFLYQADGEVDGPGFSGLASATGAITPELSAVSSGAASASQNLAYDPYVAPAPVLAATGTEVSAVGVTRSAVALAALGGALLFMSTRRRSA